MPIDAPRPIDAPVDTPVTPPMFKGYDADEGGEVRVEYVRFGNGTAATRVTAFLWQNVGSTKYFPYLDLDGCIDARDDTRWPFATNPVAERDYLDPGRIIISSNNPADEVLNVPKRAAAGNDIFGRPHPENELFFYNGVPNAADGDGDRYLTEKTKFDVIFTGSNEMPGQVFDDVLYMPADFTVTSPALSTTPFELQAGTAATFTWEVPTDNPPTGYEVMSLVGFTGSMGPVVVCVEPNDGSMTVPANLVDVVRTAYPGGGTMARQTLTHVVRELHDNNGPTGKRIDFISVWCYATPFTVPAP
jgi:hypothetical protein